MARQTDGTNQSLQSVSAISLSAYTKCAIALWLYWDAFATDNDLAFEIGTGAASIIQLNPNAADGGGSVIVSHVGNNNTASRYFSRPSAAAYHQYVINIDVAQTGAAEIVSVYVDATLQTLTDVATNDNTGNLADGVLNLMSRNNTSFFGAGRIAEFGIYGGINLDQTDATNLQTQRPNQVQSGSLLNYWKLCGVDSPELPTVGSNNLTVNGATQVAHPSAMLGSCNSTTIITGLGRKHQGFIYARPYG